MAAKASSITAPSLVAVTPYVLNLRSGFKALKQREGAPTTGPKSSGARIHFAEGITP
jgi:hypothetical protein